MLFVASLGIFRPHGPDSPLRLLELSKRKHKMHLEASKQPKIA